MKRGAPIQEPNKTLSDMKHYIGSKGGIRLIRTLAVKADGTLERDLPLEQLDRADISWYWVDFEAPSEDEAALLHDHFHFHPLAIEDCLHFLQRPKLDLYEGYQFYVLHSLNPDTLKTEELDLFVGSRYVVSFHFSRLSEIDSAWEAVSADAQSIQPGPMQVLYLVMDRIVDQYFPAMYNLEDRINELDDGTNRPHRVITRRLFRIRSDLLALRKTIVPTSEMLYRMLSMDFLKETKRYKLYFTDIYDHLLKLTAMIESNREMTSDMRDHYMSIKADRMNSIMLTLTVFTVIFMPLTFIAGIYGMNFEYMPELKWRYGYFAVLGLMAIVGVSMFIWFKKKGWLE